MTKKYYQTHKEHCKQKNKDYYKIRKAKGFDNDFHHFKREVINRIKMRPCSDCKIQYSPWVMDFDHRPGEIKLCGISSMLSHSPEAIYNEIAKCDVVCANCHRERTYKRGYGK